MIRLLLLLCVLYEGRIRPEEVAQKLESYRLAHTTKKVEQLVSRDDNAELFYVANINVKQLLELDANRKRFTYNELKPALMSTKALATVALSQYEGGYQKLPLGIYVTTRDSGPVVVRSQLPQLPVGTELTGDRKLGQKVAELFDNVHRYEQFDTLITPPEEPGTSWRLALESFYYRYPLLPVVAASYLLPLPVPVVLHGAVIGVRTAILGRPPVSNMSETLLFVPWIAALAALFLRQGRRIVKIGAATLVLLAAGDITMENPQAVLASNYWLTVHVLLIVGSYGVFLLNTLLAHAYLMGSKKVGQLLDQSLFIGTIMLITGTILGGVWAAQSWGRFWDWDPKESWAFISALFYLFAIHASFFGLITKRTLALLCGIGFLAITFTWYGVNYILGTGLHSYGFGHGGEWLYVGGVAGDLVLLLTLFVFSYKKERQRGSDHDEERSRTTR